MIRFRPLTWSFGKYGSAGKYDLNVRNQHEKTIWKKSPYSCDLKKVLKL